MSFSDLLKKPLPSKMNTEEEVATESTIGIAEEIEEMLFSESEDSTSQELTKAIKELDNNDMATEDSDEDVDDADEMDDLDDIDLSDLSDEELDEMEAELRDSDLDDLTDDEEPVELSPEEEREADDLMSLAGTTELLKSELNAEERAAFLESASETQIAVFEGFLLESDVLPVEESDEDMMTEKAFSSKTMVRFSAADRKAQLYAVALNVSARAHHDPDYIKLQKVQKMRRVLKRKIQRKYHAEAVKRMKVYFNRLRASKSSVLSAIGKKLNVTKKEEE